MWKVTVMSDRAARTDQHTRTDERPSGALYDINRSADDGELALGVRDLADHCPFGVAVTRGDTFVLSYVNAVFRRLTGTEDALVLGHPLAEVLSASTRGPLMALLDHVYRTRGDQTDVEVCGDSAR